MARIRSINKVDENIAKTKAQINELQQVLRQLEQEKINLENSEIVGIVRKDNISIEELCEIVKMFKINKKTKYSEENKENEESEENKERGQTESDD